MNPLIILTSALNTRFGAHTTEQRMQQTLDSVASIRKYCPQAKVALVEMAGIPLTKAQIEQFFLSVDYLLDFTHDEAVKEIYNSTENWDIVKNTTEVMVFGNALAQLMEREEIAKFDRVFKMSGRYQLTENFDPAFYDTVPDRIVILEKKRSHFPAQVTGGIPYQYMSRLWSWPADQTQLVIDQYGTGFMAMAQHLATGGYFDIEHMLYRFLPPELITEVPRVGLRGLLGPNGVAIED
jgi:hypothetical protein